jgi:hypothetical protein
LNQPIDNTTTANTTTANTTLNTSDDIQMYQPLSRDTPEYETPHYFKHKLTETVHPNMEVKCQEYQEIEPVDNNVPDVVYHVLEGPGPNGPSGDKLKYQAMDKQTTHNPLHQSTNPATMVTQNHLNDR